MQTWKIPDNPLISVIVPAHNEAQWLGDSLKTLLAQKTSVPYEIIVVDNASVDGTAEAAEALGVPVVFEARKSLTRARQAGYLAGRGKFLAYMDADSWAPQNWIESIAHGFKKYPQASGLYGTFKYRLKSPIHRAIFWFWFAVILRVYNWIVRGQSIAGCNFAVPRVVLEKIGGFNLKIDFYGEDVDLAKRLQKAGRIYPLHCPIESSGRRFDEEGLIIPGMVFVLNNLWVKFFGRPLLKLSRTSGESRVGGPS